MAKQTQSRPPKKTQTIEIRVSEGDKTAFLQACREAGRSASDVLRQLMRFFVIVQQLQKRYTKMIKLDFLKPMTAGIAASVVAVAGMAAIMFAPAAYATAHLNYRMVVDNGVGEIVSVGRVELGAETPPVTDSLGDAVQFEIRAISCADIEYSDCKPDHIYVDIGLITRSEHSEFNINAGPLIVKDGEVARLVHTLQDGQTLIGYFQPESET